jgi:hypothetical protein
LTDFERQQYPIRGGFFLRCYNAAMKIVGGLLLLFVGLAVLFVTAVDNSMEMGDRLTMLAHKRMLNIIGYGLLAAGTMLIARGARGLKP